jgi:hypothetical protein
MLILIVFDRYRMAVVPGKADNEKKGHRDVHHRGRLPEPAGSEEGAIHNGPVEGKNTGMMRWMARHEAKLDAHLRCETQRKAKKKTPTNHETPSF